MNKELLIEFFTEDIPARLHKNAIVDARELFLKILCKYNIEYENVEAFVSPRRLALLVTDLADNTRPVSETKRGPKIGANEQVLNGFLNSNNKTKENLEERDGYYYLNIEIPGQNITSLFADIIEEFITRMPWQKSMHWYLEKDKTLSSYWIRPIRSVMCIYGEKPIEVYIKSLGVTTGNTTYGHRFLSNGKICIKNFTDYEAQLTENKVILNFDKKKTYIESELSQQSASMGLVVKSDERLLNEVAGLVEYPFIYIGNINEKFMSLPMEVLSTSMRVHQKYFTLTYPDSNIAPFFATVTNVPITETMKKGFERVLRARLSDAMFFYKEDTDVTLEAYANRLSNVVFHEKLGTMAQKIDRMMSIANSPEEHRVIALCKADLVSQMVGEFPELQGIMGRIYASEQGEVSEVCEAISDHYKPAGAGDNLPKTFLGSRVSFFDKLDTLVGFLGVGIKPTGSKDPFALRRAAVSIIRLIFNLPHDILEDEFTWYIETLITAYADQGIALSSSVKEYVITFLKDRLIVYLSETCPVDFDLCQKIVDKCDFSNNEFKNIKNEVIKVDKLNKQPNFDVIKSAYKRVTGILNNFVLSSENFKYSGNNEYMKKLYDKLITPDVNFENIVNISNLVLDACDNVLINDADDNIRNQNFTLLKLYINLVENVFPTSLLTL